MIDKNLIRQNKKRIEYHYQVGNRVEKIVWNKTKLSQRSHGPFPVLVTHYNGNGNGNGNGNLTIHCMPTVTDTQLTQWFRPYKGL